MSTISIHMPEQTGLTSQILYLRKTSDGVLVNTGGDALTEAPASSGRFTATVGETWAETLSVTVKSSDGFAVRDGWLAVGGTIVLDGYPGYASPGNNTLEIDVTVLGQGEEGDVIQAKQGAAATWTFSLLSVPDAAYETVMLGISTSSGTPLLKKIGTLDGTDATFVMTSADMLRVHEGLHNYDVFAIDGYNAESGEYTDAILLVSKQQGVNVQPLYLQPLGPVS